MHWLTLVFIVLETMLLLFYEFPRWLEHPEERHRPWFMLLLLLLIHYNLWNGLLPDVKYFAINIKVQYMLLDGIAYLMGAYFPFYFYKAFDLPGLRFYATYGVLLFLLLPYAVFVAVYAYNGQLFLDRLVCLAVPAVYGLVVLVLIIKAIHRKSKETGNGLQYMAETVAFIAILPWELMSAFAYQEPPQELKMIMANSGFVALAFLQVTNNIRHSRQAHQETSETIQEQVPDETIPIISGLLPPFEANCKFYELSKREIDVAEQLCLGLTNPAIADKLHISLSTVKSHVENILQKTGAASRLEIVRKLLYEK